MFDRTRLFYILQAYAKVGHIIRQDQLFLGSRWDEASSTRQAYQRKAPSD